MNMGDRRALLPRGPLVATCSSTPPRLLLHLDDSTSPKGMVATPDPMVTICATEGTLVVCCLLVCGYDGIADPFPPLFQIFPFNANQFLGPGWRRQ